MRRDATHCFAALHDEKFAASQAQYKRKRSWQKGSAVHILHVKAAE